MLNTRYSRSNQKKSKVLTLDRIVLNASKVNQVSETNGEYYVRKSFLANVTITSEFDDIGIQQ